MDVEFVVSVSRVDQLIALIQFCSDLDVTLELGVDGESISRGNIRDFNDLAIKAAREQRELPRELVRMIDWGSLKEQMLADRGALQHLLSLGKKDDVLQRSSITTKTMQELERDLSSNVSQMVDADADARACVCAGVGAGVGAQEDTQ